MDAHIREGVGRKRGGVHVWDPRMHHNVTDLHMHVPTQLIASFGIRVIVGCKERVQTIIHSLESLPKLSIQYILAFYDCYALAETSPPFKKPKSEASMTAAAN